MSELFSLAVSLAGGFGAGVVFFGGLWLTVRRLDSMKNPALVILLSFVLRVAVALGVIWWLSRGELPRLALCMAGFLIARFALIKAVRFSAPAASLPITNENESCI